LEQDAFFTTQNAVLIKFGLLRFKNKFVLKKWLFTAQNAELIKVMFYLENLMNASSFTSHETIQFFFVEYN